MVRPWLQWWPVPPGEQIAALGTAAEREQIAPNCHVGCSAAGRMLSTHLAVFPGTSVDRQSSTEDDGDPELSSSSPSGLRGAREASGSDKLIGRKPTGRIPPGWQVRKAAPLSCWGLLSGRRLPGAAFLRVRAMSEV